MPAPIGGADPAGECGWPGGHRTHLGREFAEAVGQAGGKMAAQGFLTRQAVMKVGEELVALTESETAIELSEWIQEEAAYEAAEAIQAEAAQVVAAALGLGAAGSEG